MKTPCIHVIFVGLALFSSTASAQEWISWKGQSTPESQPAAQQAQPVQPVQPVQPQPVQQSISQPVPAAQVPPPQPAATNSNVSSASIDKAECDAEVATTYPAYIWAPGLSQKRKELFAACMTKRSQPSTEVSSSSSITKAECDAKVAKAYPAFIWAPGLGQKRKELFAACMAQGAGN